MTALSLSCCRCSKPYSGESDNGAPYAQDQLNARRHLYRDARAAGWRIVAWPESGLDASPAVDISTCPRCDVQKMNGVTAHRSPK